MKREIKFRQLIDGKWHYFGYIGEDERRSWVSPIILQHETDGQFTGMTDEEGREIFEGDVITNTEAVRLAGVGFTNSELEKRGIRPPDFLSVVHDIRALPLFEAQRLTEVKVVGNVHQNPELLTP